MKTRTLKTRDNLPAKFEDLVRWHPPRAIRDKADYENAQEIIDQLTNLPQLTRGQDEYLDTLATLLHAYEEEHEADLLDGVTGLDALRMLVEQHDMSASDLGRLLGDRSLGAKILSGERDLSKAHIRILAGHFELEAGVFIA